MTEKQYYVLIRTKNKSVVDWINKQLPIVTDFSDTEVEVID